MKAPPEHTSATRKNFVGYALVDFWAGLIIVGYGAIDLIMVGPFGATQIAAVGQADLFVTTLFAGVLGFSDSFAARLAKAEGAGSLGQRFLPLAVAILCVAIGLSAALTLVHGLVEPLYRLVGQVEGLVAPMADYSVARLFGVGFFLIYCAANQTLRIAGHKRLILIVLAAGMGSNVVFNALYLYVPGMLALFPSPSGAVAWATFSAEIVMATTAVALCLSRLRTRITWRQDTARGWLSSEVMPILAKGPGIGVRRLNDYLSAIVPLMLIGTISVGAVAAAAVATRIYMIFCRVPQACFASSFVLYSYAYGRSPQEATSILPRLTKYSAVATVAALIATAAVLPWLDTMFGAEIDRGLVIWLLVAYLVPLPAYFYEQLYAQVLVAKENSRVLFVVLGKEFMILVGLAMVMTIPLAWWVTAQFADPFWILASRWLGATIIAIVFVAAARQPGPNVGELRSV